MSRPRRFDRYDAGALLLLLACWPVAWVVGELVRFLWRLI